MAKQTTDKIDFAKYRSPELVASIRELLDIRGTYAKFFYQAFFGTLCVAAVLATLLFTQFSKLGWSGSALLLVFGMESALVIGVCYALTSLVNRSVTNMTRVVDLLLEVAKQVALDVNHVRSGDAEMPSAKEIVRGVYLEVFLPTIEQVVSESFWILGPPMLFVYRLTFGRLMRLVIGVLPDQTLELIGGEKLDTMAETSYRGLEKIADNESTIIGALTATQKMISHIGGKFKFLVMLPCYAVMAAVILFHAALLFAAWYAVTWVWAHQPAETTTLLRDVGNVMVRSPDPVRLPDTVRLPDPIQLPDAARWR